MCVCVCLWIMMNKKNRHLDTYFFKLLRYNFVFNNKQKIVTICQEDTTILFPKFSFFYFVCLNMNKICKKCFSLLMTDIKITLVYPVLFTDNLQLFVMYIYWIKLNESYKSKYDDVDNSSTKKNFNFFSFFNHLLSTI